MASGGTDSYESAVNKNETVAQFEDTRKSLGHRIQHWLHQTPSAVPMIVLLASVILFGLAADNFFRAGVLTLILQQIAVVGILGCAQSIVILTAGIDLSVGAMAVFTSVIMGQFTFRYGIPAPISILVGLGAGTLMGMANGALVAYVKLPPFIVTLGTWQIILAANFLYSQNETIRSQDIAAEAPMLQLFGATFRVGGTTVTLGVILLVLVVLTMAYVLRHTAWGRHVYAVGDDAEAAALSGVQVKKMLVHVYALAGFFCALAGWVMIGRYGSVSPAAATGQIGNIQSITAVVIGGISLFGGRGSILGMFFGALIVGVFELGLRLLGTDPQWTYLLIGVLIIGAVAVDQWIRKVSA
ncbi:MAG TPA: ABC transporter permease [Amaricoccus sp.]|uniref:ABC transporter permease n=1 Tax=Amaricoccus sp. TaxID=1872485 RepID=UPI001DACE8C5|nr:ABC transporter permease [Amaricoccus sp.]MCB1370648.1 ABC transporter permease [Paracoccaceae bacterium]MCC0066379.1 ABC transporter permease [Rhodovulum sp.]HPG21274.1 ABC transporter permease [Amaricoccus sp.]HRW14729.1 ABC transporter permease [Amaricoccus sp.]